MILYRFWVPFLDRELHEFMWLLVFLIGSPHQGQLCFSLLMCVCLNCGRIYILCVVEVAAIGRIKLMYCIKYLVLCVCVGILRLEFVLPSQVDVMSLWAVQMFSLFFVSVISIVLYVCPVFSMLLKYPELLFLLYIA